MKTAIETPNLLQEAQRAADSAPTRTALAEATAKLESLYLRRNEVSIALAALEKAAVEESAEHTKALLKKGEIPKFAISDDMRQARLVLRVVQDAIPIQDRQVQSVMASVCREVRRNLRPCRQRIIVRIAAAIKELQAAAREDNEVSSVVNRAGVNVALVGFLQIPELSVMEAWLHAMRAEGYEF